MQRQQRHKVRDDNHESGNFALLFSTNTYPMIMCINELWKGRWSKHAWFGSALVTSFRLVISGTLNLVCNAAKQPCCYLNVKISRLCNSYPEFTMDETKIRNTGPQSQVYTLHWKFSNLIPIFTLHVLKENFVWCFSKLHWLFVGALKPVHRWNYMDNRSWLHPLTGQIRGKKQIHHIT